MAYYLHHTIDFLNPLNEALHIELYKKDIVPDDVTTLLGNSFSVNYPTGEGDKFTKIISCEAKLSITLYSENVEEFDDFIVTFPDEWKLIAYDDNQVVFVGFLTPGEGRSEFQDKPHDISLTALDGIGLLKGTPLTKINGDNFTGVNLIIDYVIAILNKTGLDLNLRLFSNIVESSMQDRTLNTQADTFNQTGLHARTFLKSPTTFYDCYTCLERILAEYFCVYQWNGKWVILRIGELQESIGVKIWHTEYNSAGAIVGTDQNLYDPGGVGRDRLIHPVEISQFIGSNFAVKSSRYTYNYTVWPELPTNNKFESGTLFAQGNQADIEDMDGDGDTSEIIGTFKDYTIDGWEQGRVNILDFPNPVIVPISNKFFRTSVFDQFGAEIRRNVVCETDAVVNDHQFWMRSEPIPVQFGDKFKIGWSKRHDNNFVSTADAASVGNAYIVSEDNSKVLVLANNESGVSLSTGIWIDGTDPVFGMFGRLIIKYFIGQSSSEWTSIDVTSPPIPFNGTLYIAHVSEPNVAMVGARQYWKDFSFEYYPYTAGGFVPVKADYVQTSQSANYKDAIDEEVFISDSPKKVFQGALYRENLIDLTTATWHRYGVTETKYFKEIGELARFNNNYRRMWKIDGQYDGLKFTPANNPTVIEPLSFHKQFVFPDSTKLSGHYFVLVPPLTLNYSEGRADMNFIEVLEDGTIDGNSVGDSHIPLQYIFE